MGDGHTIGEAGADRVIRLGDALLQQPAGTDEPARLLVIGQMQLDRAGQRHRRRPQRQQGEGIGREVGFGDRSAAPIHPAVADLGAIGVAAPALPRRHDIAMRVQRDHRPLTETVTDDEVGGGDHPRRAHGLCRHGMTFDREAQCLQEPGRIGGVRRAIARRVVRRVADERREEGDLLLEAGKDRAADCVVNTHCIRNLVFDAHGISPWVRTSRA